MPQAVWRWTRSWGPEWALAVLATLTFLGYLGAVDLWGKREQRAAAEALDTVDHDRWLVAQIQGRPRLEKPPLPRWTSATLVTLTGQRAEWVVRLPAALSALGMIGLIYSLGRWFGGRSVGLSAGLALCSTIYFITETRQAGNDGPLAFFTTLAMYAAWRRLHGEPWNFGETAEADRESKIEDKSKSRESTSTLGGRGWAVLLHAALGLGFLTKGPIIFILVALAVLPYLMFARRLREGIRALADGWGSLLLLCLVPLALFLLPFRALTGSGGIADRCLRRWLGLADGFGAPLLLLLVLSWPVPVLLIEPEALGVWYLEMAQKAGSAGVEHHERRALLALEWFWMVMPWTPLALAGLALPFLSRGRAQRPRIWFPWCWAFANLLMFCLWNVAKPNYYLPCLPAVALLVGIEWVRVCRSAHRGLQAPRRLLQSYWVILFSTACIGPVIVAQRAPEYLGESLLIASGLALGAVLSALAWRRGAIAGALAPVVAGLSLAVLVAYGGIAPKVLGGQSHRHLADRLQKVLPADEQTLMFFDELDEGLWFYLRGRTLKPVPDSQPEFNKAYTIFKEEQEGELIWDPNLRLQADAGKMLEWIAQPDRPTNYVLIRSKVYDRLTPFLNGLATPVYREERLHRNEIVLLRIIDPMEYAAARSAAESATLR